MVIKKCRLIGQVEVSGAKNSALRLLAASLLTDEAVQILNSPNSLLDMQVHIAMLRVLGKTCIEDKHSLKIEENKKIETDLVWNERSIRNTLLILVL